VWQPISAAMPAAAARRRIIAPGVRHCPDGQRAAIVPARGAEQPSLAVLDDAGGVDVSAQCLSERVMAQHAFRATGITAYLANGGALEHAQEMAAHESPRTTKLYDRTKERLTQDEVERIRL
jgi:hypothetical protein